MKYELKRLKNAADERIPEIPLDEALLENAMKRARRPYGRYISYALTAAAACILLIFTLGSILAPGAQTKPDDVGDERYLLAQGSSTAPGPTDAPDSFEYLLAEEDLSAYHDYSPLYSAVALPDEAEFGDVVIRKETRSNEQVFIFYDRETGEVLFPRNGDIDWHGQGFAYFPASDTALVGNGEGMALIGREGPVTGYIYDYFGYVGGGVAIAAVADEDETEPDPMYLISTADGSRLSRDYAIIGTMRSGDVRLLMGHDNQELLGDFDVLDLDGRVIARVSELSGVYFDKWLSVQLPGEEAYCLIDFESREQMDGLRFTRIGFEKDGYLTVYTEEGCGLLDSEGGWVFEPGRYISIEICADGLFRAIDSQSREYLQINAQGEEVDTWRFRLDQAMDAIGEAYMNWRERMGNVGFAVVCLTAGWLLFRLGWSKQHGELMHMLITELGFAAYIAGLIFIGHRSSLDYVTIFPTDTSVADAGRMAGGWMLASFAMTASLAAAYPKLRSPMKAFLAGYALMLLPWVWKAVCCDVTVSGWRTFSMAVFGGGVLLAVLTRTGAAKRFMNWCGCLDRLNEYGKWIRIGWWMILLVAAVNFGAGCYISGQGMVQFTHRVECERGATEKLDEAWFDAVNRASGLYRESGYDDEALEALRSDEKMDYSMITAARWLHENGLDMLTENMVYTVRMTGEVELRREAEVQLVLEMAEGSPENVWQIILESPQAEEDGSVWSETVLLAAPGEALPDIDAWLYIRQRGNMDSVFAAQSYYRAELGTVLRGDDSVDYEDGTSDMALISG